MFGRRKLRKQKEAEPNKFHAKTKVVDGIKFASLKESDRYIELKSQVKQKFIYDLECHPRYDLVIDAAKVRYTSPSSAKKKASNRVIFYKADFRYRKTGSNEQVIEDVKGMDTPMSKLKRSLVEAMYNIKIDII